MARDYWFAFGNQPSAAASLAPTFITFINSSGATIAPPAVTETYPGSGLYKVSYHPTQTIAFVMDGATAALSTADRYIFGVFDPQDMFGNSLLAIGTTQTALGNTLVALGTSNIALGTTGVALGTTNVAIGTTLLGFGASTVAFGNTLIGFGVSTIALGNAIGTSLSAQGVSIIAIGDTLLALGSTFNVVISGIGSTGSTFGGVATNPDSVFGYLKRVVEFLEGDQVYTKASGALTYSSKGSSTLFVTKAIEDNTTETTRS